MLVKGEAQQYIEMLRTAGMVDSLTFYKTPSQAGGCNGLYQAVENHQATMSTIDRVVATHADAHSDMSREGGLKGLSQGIVNCQATMTTINKVEPSLAAAHSNMSREGGKNSRGKAKTTAIGTTNSRMVLELDDSTTMTTLID